MSEVDFYNLFAQRHRGVTDGWRWWELQTLGDGKEAREHAVFQVRGAVPDAQYKTGKRKGETNWKNCSEQRTFAVTFREFDAFKLEWETETGKCHHCTGTGQTIASGGPSGSTYNPCRRCGGTGAKP